MRNLPRVWVFVLVLILGVMGAVGWQYLRSQESLRRAEAEQALTSVAVLKLNEIAEWRATRIADAELLAQNPTLLASMRMWVHGPAQSPGFRDELLDDARSRMEMFVKARKFHDIRVIDAADRIIVGVHEDTEPEDATTSATLAQARASGRVAFGQIHNHGGIVLIDVVVPLFAHSDDPLMRASGLALVVQVDPPRLSLPAAAALADAERLRRNPAPRVGLATMWCSSRRCAIAPTRRSPSTCRSSSAKLAAAVGLRGTIGVVGGRDYRDVPILAATFRVDGTDWIMVSKMDEDEALATQHRETLMGLGILFAMGIAIVAVMIAMAEEAGSSERLAAAEARTELATRDAWLGAIFRAAPIGIGLVRKRILLEVSDGFCRLTGQPREEMLGETSRQFYATEEEYTACRRCRATPACGKWIGGARNHLDQCRRPTAHRVPQRRSGGCGRSRGRRHLYRSPTSPPARRKSKALIQRSRELERRQQGTRHVRLRCVARSAVAVARHRPALRLDRRGHAERDAIRDRRPPEADAQSRGPHGAPA